MGSDPVLTDDELAHLIICAYMEAHGGSHAVPSPNGLRVGHAILARIRRPLEARGIEAGARNTKSDMLHWAVAQWQSEVEHRPLQNVHRAGLDTSWRQVIRYAGGDDMAICGPRHHDLVEDRALGRQHAAGGG